MAAKQMMPALRAVLSRLKATLDLSIDIMTPLAEQQQPQCESDGCG
jgi:hypothetical protein